MQTTNPPTPATYYASLKSLAAQKKYLGIKYFTEYRELVSTTAIIKDFFQKEGAEYIQLNTGEEIRLDRLVQVDGQNSPGFGHLDFTCDCNQ